MIMYPVPSSVRRTCSVMLSFVNSKTRNKLIITDDLDLVCKELGWNKEKVEACGGVTAFMHQHEKNSDF
jgi:L,D-peptidoglycan transpeptidase YkuD (ErfK/YbiS/YcfS/YnhG family)